jgi:elongation of very long chain fatty acids protein 4
LYRLKHTAKPNATTPPPAATPAAPATATATTVSLSLYSDHDLRPWMLSYNVYQTLLNTYVVLELIREVWLNPSMTSVWGNSLVPPGHPDGRRLSFLILVHAQNKIIELSDTIFMVLRGKARQVTTLHVWHHMLLLWSWYLVVRFACGGDAYFGALVNSVTHILVYLHYTMSTFGWDTGGWKKHLTSVQLLQFVVCGAHGVYCLYHGNYPRWLCCLNLFVQVNMAFLFTTFFKVTYGGTREKSATNGVAAANGVAAPTGLTGLTAATAPAALTTDASTTAALPTYTMEDVKTRNGSASVHWCVNGDLVLDFSNFVHTHPGGNCIVLASGIDATILLQTYHPNGIPKQVLHGLVVGRLATQNNSYYGRWWLRVE